MRSRSAVCLLSLLLAVFLTGGCARGRKTPAPADPAAVAAAVDSFIQAHNAAIAARDTDGVVALYADDAFVLPAGGPRVQGREAIREMWARSLATPGLEMTLASGHQLVSEGGDMVADIGTYDFRMSGPDGRPLRDVGKYVTVMRKVDGRWKMVVDIWNSDPAFAQVK